MPSYVISSKCDGCKAQDRTACQYICPNDLMTLDRQKMKAYNRDPVMCWECFNCVKLCPAQAIEVRGYSDFVPMGASVSALRSTEDILWTDESYRDVYAQAGLKIVTTYHPLAKGDEPYRWISETRIAPWTIYVLARK